MIQGLRSSGQYDKVYFLAVQMIQDHIKIIDFGCFTNPLGFVQSQQELDREVFV
jgi:hypothetical protein